MITYWILRLASALVPKVPRRLALRIAAWLGLVAAHIAPSRHAVRENLRHVLESTEVAADLESLVRSVFRTQAQNYADLMAIPRMSPDGIRQLVDMGEAAEYIREHEDGRGLVVVTAHFGNLDVVAQVIGLRGSNAAAVVEHLEPESLFELVCSLRGFHGLKLMPVGGDPRRLYRTLQDGGILLLAGDRGVSGGVSRRFFGASTRLPDGYARLVRKTNARIGIAASYRHPDGSFSVRGHLLDEPDPGLGREEFVAELMSRVVGEIEKLIAKDPGQWVVFERIWGADEW